MDWVRFFRSGWVGSELQCYVDRTVRLEFVVRTKICFMVMCYLLRKLVGSIPDCKDYFAGKQSSVVQSFG